MNKLIVTLAMVATISTQSYAAETDSMDKVREEVSGMMRDPDSTKFKDLKSYGDMNDCVKGQFNSRNGFGGMIGWTDFVYVSKGRTLLVQSPKDDIDTRIKNYNEGVRKCNKGMDGYDIMAGRSY